MNIFEAIILGLVEGLTEFLPISSTAHLILFSKILNLEENDFLKTFIIFIQSGAILGVLFLYWRNLIFKKQILTRVIFAFVPTALVGFLFYKVVKNIIFSEIEIILVALFIGGVLMLVFENYYQKRNDKIRKEEIGLKESFIIGLAQSLAVIPGVSRSGATILSGLAMNLDRKIIVEFSFLLAIPTIIAATVYDIYVSWENLTFNNFYLLMIGFLFSFISAIISVSFFLNYISQKSFVFFGVYRIVLTIVLGIYFLIYI